MRKNDKACHILGVVTQHEVLPFEFVPLRMSVDRVASKDTWYKGWDEGEAGQHKALGTVEGRRIFDGIFGRHLCGHSA